MEGKAGPQGGVKTPPYNKREQGGKAKHPRFGKIPRAAYMPPLRPDGNWQFIISIRNHCKAVGRGLAPAAVRRGLFAKKFFPPVDKPKRACYSNDVSKN